MRPMNDLVAPFEIVNTSRKNFLALGVKQARIVADKPDRLKNIAVRSFRGEAEPVADVAYAQKKPGAKKRRDKFAYAEKEMAPATAFYFSLYRYLLFSLSS